MSLSSWMNPYGAVPAALENVRQSMKDVLSGYLEQKALEQKYNLENARTDVALAEQEARQKAIENEYALGLRNYALKTQQAQDEAEYRRGQLAHGERALSIQGEHQKSMEDIERSKADTARKAAESNMAVDQARIKQINAQLQQFQRDSSIDTVANHASRQGIPDWFIKNGIGIDPQARVPGMAVANIGSAFWGMMAKDPRGTSMLGKFWKDKSILDDMWNKIEKRQATAKEIEDARALAADLQKQKDQLSRTRIDRKDMIDAVKAYSNMVGITPEQAEAKAAALASSGSGAILPTIYSPATVAPKSKAAEPAPSTSQADYTDTLQMGAPGTPTLQQSVSSALKDVVPGKVYRGVKTSFGGAREPENIPQGWKQTGETYKGKPVYLDDKGNRRVYE